MKISIIAPFTFGYIDALAEEFEADGENEVNYINTSEIKFEYTSVLQRVENFFMKKFLKKNLKRRYKAKRILEKLEEKGKQDLILIVRPDKLEKEFLLELKKMTTILATFLFDSIHHLSKQIELLPIFDEVFSYEPDDVKEFNLKFLPNFIPEDHFSQRKNLSGVFNISSYDERFQVVEEIARQLKNLDYPFKFIARKEKPITHPNVEIVSEYISLVETKKYIEEAKFLLDIQKHSQKGLSFRVFEALGYDKKLITTNRDVINYDFYNPENILVIDKDKPQIPEGFLKSKIVPVPDEIKNRYRRKTWIKTMLGYMER